MAIAARLTEKLWKVKIRQNHNTSPPSITVASSVYWMWLPTELLGQSKVNVSHIPIACESRTDIIFGVEIGLIDDTQKVLEIRRSAHLH